MHYHILGGQKQIRTKMASYIYYLNICNSQGQVFFSPPETTLMVRASIAVGHKGLSNMRRLLFIVFDRPISHCLKPVAAIEFCGFCKIAYRFLGRVPPINTCLCNFCP